MGSCEKILESIRNDCNSNISLINADAEKTCGEIIAKGKAEADKAAAEIAAKAEKKSAQLRLAAKSRAELEKRNALLRNRRKEIDITFNQAYEYLLQLDSESYFNTIYKLAKKLSGKQGVILLNSKDLSRMPSDFAQKLKQNGVKAEISDKPADITGGFILKCGDIEENMSFASLFSDNREKVEDLINRELFAD